MSELPPETPVDESAEPGTDDGNVAVPVPIDSSAATSGDGGSTLDSLPPSLPA